jgi:hypothetical protein
MLTSISPDISYIWDVSTRFVYWLFFPYFPVSSSSICVSCGTNDLFPMGFPIVSEAIELFTMKELDQLVDLSIQNSLQRSSI